jgi:hypothetical protein
MPVVPDNWTDTESSNEMLYSIGWFVLALFVFSTDPFLFSFHYTRSLTSTLVIVSIGIGITFGTILVYFLHTNDFVQFFFDVDAPGLIDVTNQSHENPVEHQYTVSIDDVTDELMACTCPHQVHRDACSKHIAAIAFATDEGTLKSFNSKFYDQRFILLLIT